MDDDLTETTELERRRAKGRKIVNILKLLAHPIRLSILCGLMHHGEMSVTQLISAEQGRSSQSQISQFLARMRRENIVDYRKESQTNYYRISSSEVKKIIETLFEIYCDKHESKVPSEETA